MCADDHGAASLLGGIAARSVTYGTTAGSMLRASDVNMTSNETTCDVHERGRRVGTLRLRLAGRHNVLNALGAAGAARALDVPWPDILGPLSEFRGVGRRFEVLGEAAGVTVVDDYAHHPTEIEATLLAARSRFADARLVAVFQPHLYTRTRDFAHAFGRALALADVAWVTDVFPAREEPIAGVSGALVADEAQEAGADVRYHASLETLGGAVLESVADGDVVVALGAGSIDSFGSSLLRALEEERA